MDQGETGRKGGLREEVRMDEKRGWSLRGRGGKERNNGRSGGEGRRRRTRAMEEGRSSSRLIYRCAGHAAEAVFEGCAKTLSTHLHLVCDDSSRFTTPVHPSNAPLV